MQGAGFYWNRTCHDGLFDKEITRYMLIFVKVTSGAFFILVRI